MTFQEISSQTNIKITQYIYQTGKIVGYKKIYNNMIVPLIQFKDLTRIWILPNEIKLHNIIK
uniref:Cytochrome b6-f complex subunit PetP n=1 Tax=Antithamnion hubbsii TaxID=1005974 RepID=A0A4D6WLR8_9FLOR|nr:cytochrome b6-f complex subunit PetP [Antithamnion hubbsii]